MINNILEKKNITSLLVSLTFFNIELHNSHFNFKIWKYEDLAITVEIHWLLQHSTIFNCIIMIYIFNQALHYGADLTQGQF